jgi:hypothetical protein
MTSPVLSKAICAWVAVGVLVLASCGASNGSPTASRSTPAPARTPRPPSVTSPRGRPPAVQPADCNRGTRLSRGTVVVVDYLDFVQVNGTQFVSGLALAAPRLYRGPLGARVSTVTCTLANRSRNLTPSAHTVNGDAGYLSVGTVIYALPGWQNTCRLAAKFQGQIHIYLAYVEVAGKAVPRVCAKH